MIFSIIVWSQFEPLNIFSKTLCTKIPNAASGEYPSTFKRSNYRLKFLELDDSRVWPSITTDSILGYLMAEKGNIKKYRNSIIKSRLDNLVPSKIK